MPKVYLEESTIKERIHALAGDISNDYDELIAIIVLKGAMFFASDLLRELTIPVKIDTLYLGSYGMKGTAQGAVRLNNDITIDIADKDVLIIEDIVDTGNTMHFIYDLFKLRKVRSIRLCSLLSKPSKRQRDISIDYLGFEIPDEFVVGYGFDYKEKYRSLPYIGTLSEEEKD
jgi:hypoxanthine phosphoribosyltransferase